jgi:hypothetical protein
LGSANICFELRCPFWQRSEGFCQITFGSCLGEVQGHMNLDVCGDTPHHRRTVFSSAVLKGCGLRSSGNQCNQRASGEKLFAQRSRRPDLEISAVFARSPATQDGLCTLFAYVWYLNTWCPTQPVKLVGNGRQDARDRAYLLYFGFCSFFEIVQIIAFKRYVGSVLGCFAQLPPACPSRLSGYVRIYPDHPQYHCAS